MVEIFLKNKKIELQMKTSHLNSIPQVQPSMPVGKKNAVDSKI